MRLPKSCLLLLLLLLGHLCCPQFLLLLPVLRKSCLIVGLELLGGHHVLACDGLEVALTLEHWASHKALDLGSFLLLAGLPTDDKLLYVILLLEIEKLADIGSTFGAQSTRLVIISKTWDFLSTLLHNNQVHDCQVRSNDAAAN